MNFNQFAEFEKRKHHDFFLPYYKQQGYEVITDNLGKNTDWDVLLKTPDGNIRVDEKARMADYGDFLVEIVQDLKTGNKGWLFKEKDYYFYGSWNKNKEPQSLYSINSNMLQSFI